MGNQLAQLCILWVFPFLVLSWSSRKRPHQTGVLTGRALGIIASPASLGLYSLYFYAVEYNWLGLPLAFLGMLGLGLSMFHNSLPYSIGTTVGFIPERTIIEGSLQIKMLVVEGFVWALIYGLIGAAGIDAVIQRRALSRQTK